MERIDALLSSSDMVHAVARPEILVLILILWLLLRRRSAGSDLQNRSERILEERFEEGEISFETYQRIRNGTHQVGG